MRILHAAIALLEHDQQRFDLGSGVFALDAQAELQPASGGHHRRKGEQLLRHSSRVVLDDGGNNFDYDYDAERADEERDGLFDELPDDRSTLRGSGRGGSPPRRHTHAHVVRRGRHQRQHQSLSASSTARKMSTNGHVDQELQHDSYIAGGSSSGILGSSPRRRSSSSFSDLDTDLEQFLDQETSTSSSSDDRVAPVYVRDPLFQTIGGPAVVEYPDPPIDGKVILLIATVFALVTFVGGVCCAVIFDPAVSAHVDLSGETVGKDGKTDEKTLGKVLNKDITLLPKRPPRPKSELQPDTAGEPAATAPAVQPDKAVEPAATAPAVQPNQAVEPAAAAAAVQPQKAGEPAAVAALQPEKAGRPSAAAPAVQPQKAAGEPAAAAALQPEKAGEPAAAAAGEKRGDGQAPA